MPIRIYADAAFRMGQTHQICQDYAAVGGHGDTVVAALSDGCSSEEDTDIGARVLARSAVRMLCLAPDMSAQSIERLVSDDAVRAARMLDTDQKAVFATLMTIAQTPARWEVHCWGDGIIGVRNRRPGDAVIHVIVWPDNQPHYPVYSTMGVQSNNHPSQTVIYISNGEIDTVVTHQLPCGVFSLCLSHEEVDMVFVGSDGWTSFVEKGNRKPVPVEDVLRRLLPLNTSGPAFVRRRMGAFMRGLAKTTWMHGDDLSLAAICRREK